MTQPFQDRLTPSDVSSALQVTEGTLAVWRSTDRYDLPFIKIGRKVFYRATDVERFIEKQTKRRVIGTSA